MGFRYLEGIAIADVAFEATGKTEQELFQSAADAVIDTMANPQTVKPHITKTIELEHEKLETLLFDFLQEFIYFKDADGIVFHDAKVMLKKNKTYKLSATVTADTVKHKEQELRNDVKAVTMHQFKIEQTKTGWKATVILDI